MSNIEWNADSDRLTEPLHWRKPRRVFVNSMSDLFHEAVPFEFIDRVFAVMALCPQHEFQVLTKRPERMAEYLLHSGGKVNGKTLEREAHIGLTAMSIVFETRHADRESTIGKDVILHRDGELVKWPLPNVWLGTSVEDHARADERIPWLLRCPAAVRFLSVEPLLEAVDLSFWLDRARYNAVYASGKRLDRIGTVDWVIVGGESGAKARPCDIAWIRSVVTQCKGAGVPCFVKQLGARPFLEDHAFCRKCSTWAHADDWDLCKVSDADHRTADGVIDHCGRVNRTYTGDPQQLTDRKGGDPAEWPEDLRVREMPAAAERARAEAEDAA